MPPGHEQPIDHPDLARYPDAPVAHYTDDDGTRYRVPVRSVPDEAVAVPIHDLVQARAAIHQLAQLLDSGAGDEPFVEMLGHTMAHLTSEQPSHSRHDVVHDLEGLSRRLNDHLPSW